MTGDAFWLGSRTWTPAEATAALPLVRRIADDLVGCYRRWRAAVDAFEYAVAAVAPGGSDAEAERLMAEAQTRAAEIDELRAELERLDIRVIRVEAGLLAFRGMQEPGVVAPLYWAPWCVAPTYDLPGRASVCGTSTSWPSRAHHVAGKRSRA